MLAKLKRIEVLISNALIDSNISYDEIVLANNLNMTIWIWRYERFIENFSLFVKQFYCFVWRVEKIQKAKTQNL